MLLSLLRGLLGTESTAKLKPSAAAPVEVPQSKPKLQPVTEPTAPASAEPSAPPSADTARRVTPRRVSPLRPNSPLPPISTRLPSRLTTADRDERTVISFRLAVSGSNGSPSAAPGADRVAAKPQSTVRLAGGPQQADDPRAARRSRGQLSLKAAGLGSPAQRRALATVSIRTTGELLAAEPAEIVSRLELDPAAEKTLRRWQRAIRLSRQLPGMTPLEALLLRAVHRSTLRQIAAESPGRLYRDLARFALSSPGTRLLGENSLPSQERVKRWVEAARQRLQTPPQPAANAGNL